jgi:hypothetical protein
MEGLVFCGALLVFGLWALSRLFKSSPVNVTNGVWSRFLAQGTPARGILLAVDPQGQRVSGVVPSESRQVTIDVELPGQAPYEVRTRVTYPTTLREAVVPGASVELRVTPGNRSRLVIVGPGAGISAVVPPAVKPNP